MTTTKVQFNPSTLKASYNPVTKKALVSHSISDHDCAFCGVGTTPKYMTVEFSGYSDIECTTWEMVGDRSHKLIGDYSSEIEGIHVLEQVEGEFPKADWCHWQKIIPVSGLEWEYFNNLDCTPPPFASYTADSIKILVSRYVNHTMIKILPYDGVSYTCILWINLSCVDQPDCSCSGGAEIYNDGRIEGGTYKICDNRHPGGCP